MEKRALDRILKEFIDSELNVIGYNDTPSNSPDMASNVGTKTTDYNVRLSHQPFSDNDLAKLGYSFPLAIYEDETGQSLKEAIANEIYSFSNEGSFASLSEDEKAEFLKIAEEVLERSKQMVDESVSEQEIKKMMEDKFTSKKDTSITSKKADLLSKAESISDILDALSKEDKELLLKKLEQ